jgi:hypothetical protein
VASHGLDDPSSHGLGSVLLGWQPMVVAVQPMTVDQAWYMVVVSVVVLVYPRRKEMSVVVLSTHSIFVNMAIATRRTLL